MLRQRGVGKWQVDFSDAPQQLHTLAVLLVSGLGSEAQ